MELIKEESISFSAAIVRGAQDAIIGQTRDSTIMSWNAGAERLFGYTEEEVLGRPADLLPVRPHSGDLPSVVEQIRRGEILPPYEDRFQHKDGEIIFASVALSPVWDGPEEFVGISLIIRPISTESLNNAETDSQMLHLSRLSAAGKMAVAFAHELNQPLTAISMYLNAASRLLRAREICEEATLTTAIDRASEQTRRATQTLHRLRRFVAKKDSQHQSLFIGKALTEASELALLLARDAGVG